MKHWGRFYFPFSFAQQSDIKDQAAVFKTIQSLALTDVASALKLPVTDSEKFNRFDTDVHIWQPARYPTVQRFDDHLNKIFNGHSAKQLSVALIHNCVYNYLPKALIGLMVVNLGNKDQA